MRQYIPLVLVLAVLMIPGCVEPETVNETVTITQTPVTTPEPAETAVRTTAPPPEEMAYLSGIKCVMDQTTERTYHCNGNVRVKSGPTREIVVIARYADNNTFLSGTVELGGSDAISKPFVVFPDLKYQDRTPTYSVKVDNIEYPVRWSGSTGIAWANLR